MVTLCSLVYKHLRFLLSSAFKHFRRVRITSKIVSFAFSRLSVRLHILLGSPRKDLSEIWYCRLLLQSVNGI